MKAYENHDIILSDEDNRCYDKAASSPIDDFLRHSAFKYPTYERYNHDTVIVGLGRQTIYQYWLVKQSWGSKFAHGGYMKIQATDSVDDAPFCI